MTMISIDFDVFKVITARRASANVSENDVLRDVFGLPTKPTSETGNRGGTNGAGESLPRSSRFSADAAPNLHTVSREWRSKGVRFPEGTEFRARYKGLLYLGRVSDGALVVNGMPFNSPSSAAMSITGNPVNGWTFWECRFPGKKSWQTIKSLRSW